MADFSAETHDNVLLSFRGNPNDVRVSTVAGGVEIIIDLQGNAELTLTPTAKADVQADVATDTAATDASVQADTTTEA
jgi:hypothetical protein